MHEPRNVFNFVRNAGKHDGNLKTSKSRNIQRALKLCFGTISTPKSTKHDLLLLMTKWKYVSSTVLQIEHCCLWQRNRITFRLAAGPSIFCERWLLVTIQGPLAHSGRKCCQLNRLQAHLHTTKYGLYLDQPPCYKLLLGFWWDISGQCRLITKKSAISYFVWCVFTNTDVVWRKQIFVFKIITFYLISRGMKSMFSDESARVGTYDTFYGYGTVDTVGTVRWGTVRWVRWVRYCGYGGYGTVRAGTHPPYPPYSTHSTHCTVPSLPTVPYPAYPLYRTHRTHRTVPTVPTVPYHRTQCTAPFTAPSFLRTVPPHRALLLKFKKFTLKKNIMYYNVDLRFFNPP